MPVTHLTIADRLGACHRARYVFRDHPEYDRGDLPPETVERFIAMARSCFNYPDEEAYERIRRKFREDDSFITVTSEDGEPEAFQIFRRRRLRVNGHDLLVHHVNQAATAPEVAGRGIASVLRNFILDRERPDVISGVSANPTVYTLNRRIAAERGLLIFPNDRPHPATISELGWRIHEAFQLNRGPTDARLVRTYTEAAPPYPKPHPLKDALDLQPNQHVLYLVLGPKILQLLAM